MTVWGLPASAILRELAANAAMGIPSVRRRRLQAPRTGSTSYAFEAAKIIAEFEFLRGSAGSLNGRTVVEIGPGDALGLAPLFLSGGCERYIAIDRFPGDVWGARAAALYDEIERHRSPFIPQWRQRVQLLNTSIEAACEELPKADLLVSFDVIEHLANLPCAVRNMAAMLKPDGVMIHRVDYGPHGVWLSASDPLSFLRVPGWLWNAIGSNRGYPNRTRHPELVRLLKEAGLQVVDRVTQLKCGDVMDAEIACGFAPELRLGQAFNFRSGRS